jgi:hypothetical protein
MLIEKAKEMNAKMELTKECAFSDGWLAGFKTRHRIRKLDISGEQKSSDQEAAEEYIDTFAKIVQEHDLKPEQIHNADETGLLWRCLPTKTLTSGDEKVADRFKLNKALLSVLCCANAAGTYRVKLLVIGKYQHLRAFKNVRHLPVHIRYHILKSGKLRYPATLWSQRCRISQLLLYYCPTYTVRRTERVSIQCVFHGY